MLPSYRELRCSKILFEGAPRASDPPTARARLAPCLGEAGACPPQRLEGSGLPVATLEVAGRRASGRGLSWEAAEIAAGLEALEIWACQQARPGLPAWDLLAGAEASERLEPGCRSGVAAGTHLLEALHSALLEVLERDAVACHLEASRRSGRTPPRVRLGSLGPGLAREVAQRLQGAGLAPLLFDCTLDTRVPAYLAFCSDGEGRQARGTGAHLDRQVAMARALGEAAQRHALGIFDGDWPGRDRLAAELEQTDFAPALGAMPSFEADLAHLLARLRAVGIRGVLAWDLTPPGWSLPIVRVAVPGLAGGPGGEARAAAFAERRVARAS